MKLKNKKTGEICNWCIDKDVIRTCDGTVVYDSLAELNAEWEDYEEPKGYWYIDTTEGAIVEHTSEQFELTDKDRKEIGNYFETKEEAEKAVERLCAWKRLKDNGMIKYSFQKEKTGIDLDFYTLTILAPRDKDSLNLLFGGE